MSIWSGHLRVWIQECTFSTATAIWDHSGECRGPGTRHTATARDWRCLVDVQTIKVGYVASWIAFPSRPLYCCIWSITMAIGERIYFTVFLKEWFLCFFFSCGVPNILFLFVNSHLENYRTMQTSRSPLPYAGDEVNFCHFHPIEGTPVTQSVDFFLQIAFMFNATTSFFPYL